MATHSNDTIRKYDEIATLFMDGKGRLAVAAMEDMGMYMIPGLLDYLVEEKFSHDLAIHAAKSYFYIKSR